MTGQTMLSATGGDAAAIIDFALNHGGGGISAVPAPSPDHRDLLLGVVPKGRSITSLKAIADEFRIRPERIIERQAITDADSFVTYVQAFMRPGQTMLFAQAVGKEPSITAAIDYHAARADDRDPVPAWCSHAAVLNLTLSRALNAWLGLAVRGYVSQKAFAQHIYERQYDLTSPPADWMMLSPSAIDVIRNCLNLHDDPGFQVGNDDLTDPTVAEDDGLTPSIPRSFVYKLRQVRWGSRIAMLNLAKGIELAGQVVARESFNPRTGDREVFFKDENETRDVAGRKVVVPEAFLLNIPVFEGGPAHLLPVALVYKREGSSPAWYASIPDVHQVVKAAVARVAEDVRARLGVPLVYGA